MAFRMIFLHTFGNIVKNGRLSSSGRGYDQGSLSLADGAKKIENPGGHPAILGLEGKFFLWLDGGKLIEAILLLPFLQRHPVHCMYVCNLGVWPALVRVGIGPDDRALAQFEPTNQFPWQERIMRGGLAAPRGVEQSAGIFVVKVENTFHFQKVLTGLFVFAHERVQKMASDAGVPEEWV